jgi:Heterokaryon incompatibility protein (HET)
VSTAHSLELHSSQPKTKMQKFKKTAVRLLQKARRSNSDSIDSPKNSIASGLKSSSVNSEKYIHTPISVDGHIRVIELLPGKGKEPIQCTLKTVSRKQVEDMYEAISYVWGDSEELIDIKCNGKRLPITRNLFDVLHTIRHALEIKLLWADAICINQKDDTEKGHQVKRMGEVYENAKRVLIWLGRDEEAMAEDCFALIRETVHYFNEEAKKYESYEDIPPLTAPGPISSDIARWEKVRKLGRLPWFERAWVVQESGLAKNCILLLGKHCMDFAELVALAVLKAHYRHLDRVVGGGLGLGQLADAFITIQCRYTNSQTWRHSNRIIDETCKSSKITPDHFIVALESGRGLKTSNKRDHVYAFLGSPAARKDNGDLLVEPDYTKTVDQVYLDIAVELLQRPQEAKLVLLLVEHASKDAILGCDIPSWVPRWDRDLGSYSIGNSTFYRYRASGRAASFSPQILDGKRLALRGFIFDSLAWTSHWLLEKNFSLYAADWEEKFRSARKPAFDYLIEELLAAASSSLNELLDDILFTMVLGLRTYYGDRTAMMKQIKEDFEAYVNLTRRAATSDQPLANLNHGDPLNFLYYLEYIRGRRMTVTQSRRLGIVPVFAQSGDICCIVRGLHVPLILRKTSEGYYNLVGSAFINGVMAGELIAQLDEGAYEETEIILV